ncbi:MAG TPA: hypothetical protein VFD30_01480 [Terriglobia bacterium]|nr:hypothetical protein [Terriglobia bacterium]
MSSTERSTSEKVLVSEYVKGPFVPISHLAHDWELHVGVTLSPAEERTMVREPAQAIPDAVAKRLPKVRVLVVPFVGCRDSGDFVSQSKPEGETHSAVWVETERLITLLLACRELDAHDTGFEFLASIAELTRTRLSSEELGRFTELLEKELHAGVQGEIDEDALAAKQSLVASRGWRRRRGSFEDYRDIAFAGTLAEYMHGLWHDVQIRVGPNHLPFPHLRRRLELMAEMFPPNPGYQVFAADLETQQ